MSILRSYKGSQDYSGQLKNILPRFVLAYQNSANKFSDKPFITSVDSRGSETTKNFGEFDQDVKSAISVIREKVPAGYTVCIASENSYHFAKFIVAVLLEGIPLCVLNPEDGSTRTLKKLEIFENKYCLVSSKKYSTEFRKDFPHAFCVDDEIAEKKVELKNPKENLEQPFILVFTSGSTGYAKTVEQLEAGVLTNCDALIERHDLAPGKTIGTPLPLFHVNALEFSFLTCLLSGAHLILFENFQLRQSLELVEKYKIDILSVIPDILRIISEDLQSSPIPKNLKYFVTAAAPLSPQLAKTIIEKFPCPVLQGFGLSEAVNFSALMPKDLKKEAYQFWMTHYQRPSIGTAVRGNEIFILDDNLKPVQAGVEGDVAIRGFNVMRGYRNTDNSKIFVADYLLTGDRGFFQISESGENFYFLTGRKKEVIKKNGTTISLVEIDDILNQFFKTISVGFEHDLSGEEIGIVVQIENETEITELAEKITTFILQNIPDYMRPRAIVFTKAPIKTASGKPVRWKFVKAFVKLKSIVLTKKILNLGIVDLV